MSESMNELGGFVMKIVGAYQMSFGQLRPEVHAKILMQRRIEEVKPILNDLGIAHSVVAPAGHFASGAAALAFEENMEVRDVVFYHEVSAVGTVHGVYARIGAVRSEFVPRFG
jgi:hypothetical protein